jgi:hypothetical protein
MERLVTATVKVEEEKIKQLVGVCREKEKRIKTKQTNDNSFRWHLVVLAKREK